MKRAPTGNRKYFLVFFVIISVTFLIGCDGAIPTSPIINSFTADSITIDEGDSIALNWTVTDATTVTIDQGIGSVALTGSTSVSPTTATTYTLTATNDAGSSTAAVTIIVNKTLILQPGPAEGKDSMVVTQVPDTNYENNQYFSLGNLSVSVIVRAHLQFDVSILPTDAIIVNADLKLYQYQTIGTEGFVIGLHQVTENWEENMITWNNQPDYMPSPESTVTVNIGELTWLSWNITSLLQGWLDGSIANYGVVLKDTDEPLGDTFIRCYSSDYQANPILCPKLVITYYVP